MARYDISIDEIRELSVPVDSFNYSGIYFLLRNSNVVYVGQSKNVSARIHYHTIEKDFDSFYAVPCAKQDLDDLEAYYIVLFSPEFNFTLPINTLYVTIDQAIHRLHLNSRKLKMNLHKLNIFPVWNSYYHIGSFIGLPNKFYTNI